MKFRYKRVEIFIPVISLWHHFDRKYFWYRW